MLKLYYGEYQLVKHTISQLATKNNMKIKYSTNIFDSLLTQHGLFSTPTCIYTLYDSNLFKDKSKYEYLVDACNNSSSIYCIIIEGIDKKSSFYKYFKNDIEVVSKPKKSVNLVDELYKDLHVLNTIEEKDRVSFLYKVYYDYKHRKYAKVAGFCINEVLTGKIPVKNIFQIFLLTI